MIFEQKDEFREGDRILRVSREEIKDTNTHGFIWTASPPIEKKLWSSRQVQKRKTSPSSQNLSCSFEGLKIAFKARKFIIASQTPPTILLRLKKLSEDFSRETKAILVNLIARKEEPISKARWQFADRHKKTYTHRRVQTRPNSLKNRSKHLGKTNQTQLTWLGICRDKETQCNGTMLGEKSASRSR